MERLAVPKWQAGCPRPLQGPGPRLHRLDHGGRVQVLDVAVGGRHGGMAQLGLNDVDRRASVANS